MPHGNRDYFTSIPMSTVYSMIDLAELAARIGSIVTFDRRGNVVWLDGFEEGIAQWERLGSGADWKVDISTDRAFSGGYSCILKPHSGGSLYAAIERAHYALPKGKIGLELAFSLSLYLSVFALYCVIYQGGKQYVFKIKYVWDDLAWYYLDVNNVYQKLLDGDDLATDDILWCRCKMVFNTEKGEYVRFLLNDKVYDMSGIDGPVANIDHRSLILLGIEVFGESGQSPSNYVDNIILTINE